MPTPVTQTLTRTSSKKYTYFIKSKYYPEKYTESLFSSRGNWIKIQEQEKGGQAPPDLYQYNSSSNINNKVIDFVWLDSKKFRQDPRYNRLPARLTNFVTLVYYLSY